MYSNKPFLHFNLFFILIISFNIQIKASNSIFSEYISGNNKYIFDYHSAFNDTVGPVITEVQISKDSVWKGQEINFIIITSDTSTPSSIIFQAEFFLDSIGENGSGFPLEPLDGLYDSTYEVLLGSLDTEDLVYGYYKLFFHSMDSLENWGEFSIDSIFIKDNSSNWPMSGFNAQHTNYNEKDTVNLPLRLKWSKEIDTLELNKSIIINDIVYITWGGFFIAGGWPEGAEISALDIEDGSEMWNYSFGSIYSIDNPSFAYGLIFVQTCNHTPGSYISAFDATSGQIVWQAQYNTQWQVSEGPIIANKKIFIDGGEYGGMYCFNAFTGDTLWFAQLPQIFGWSPTYYNGFVYSTYSEASFIKINADSGNIIHYQGNFNYPGNTGTISNGRMITVNPIASLDLSTYQTLWSKSGLVTPAVGYNKVFLVDAGKLKVYTEISGQFLWEFNGDAQLIYSPVLANNYVFVSSDSNIYVLDINTEELKWNFPVGGKISIGNGKLFISSKNGELHCFETGSSSDIKDYKDIPASFFLYQNFPNPFNPSTKISWQSPVSSWQTLRVYDVLGNEVASLVSEYRDAGIYEIDFNASNLASGVYYYQLRVGNFIQTKKMLMLK